VTDEETPIFERGDVVYGDDPFKGEEDARPWLILSNMKAVRSTATSISH
jgi:mRNA-degrading endonuclease toxin of MazEF toxin-antitoxin module